MKKCWILPKAFSHPYNVLPAIFLRRNPVRGKTQGATHPVKFPLSVSFSFIFHICSPIRFVYFFLHLILKSRATRILEVITSFSDSKISLLEGSRHSHLASPYSHLVPVPSAWCRLSILWSLSGLIRKDQGSILCCLTGSCHGPQAWE